MTQAARWQVFTKPGIVAIVGAGGKTTVLSKLVEYGGLAGQPRLVTTTTKLYESQVAQWKPYYGTDINEAERICHEAVQRGRCAAWFTAVNGTKVEAVPATAIDDMHELHPCWQIIVEADGAKEKWLKAPKKTEPVIPSMTNTTIGVINLQMLGTALDTEHVYNMEDVSRIMEREPGAVVTPRMLAKLVQHPEGLFQYSKGDKVLFCTGYDSVPKRAVEAFLDEIAGMPCTYVVLADGYKASCEIRRLIRWK